MVIKSNRRRIHFVVFTLSPFIPLYENDLFAGARIALNDTQDTSLLASVVVDLEDQSTVLSVEAERRFDDHWKLEADTHWFISIDRDNLLNSVKDDSYLTVQLRLFLNGAGSIADKSGNRFSFLHGEQAAFSARNPAGW
jgi:hypothetical protein